MVDREKFIPFKPLIIFVFAMFLLFLLMEILK